MHDEPSSVPGFVAELVRAANEVDLLTLTELSGLMLRSGVAISDTRDQVMSPGLSTGRDLGNISGELRSMALMQRGFRPTMRDDPA